MSGAEAAIYREFGIKGKLDVRFLHGYPWVSILNRARHPGEGSFSGYFNPGIWKLIRRRNSDAVVTYTGVRVRDFLDSGDRREPKGTAVTFGTDVHDLIPRDSSPWKLELKKWFWAAICSGWQMWCYPFRASAHRDANPRRRGAGDNGGVHYSR